MIEIKIEKKQCYCVKCEAFQQEELVYEKITCNNLLHAMLTLVTGVWLFVWLYNRKMSKEETGHNLRLALFAAKCMKCGGPLTLSSFTDHDISRIVIE